MGDWSSILGNLLGIGSQIGGAALQQKNLDNGFNYINQIGQTALGQNTSNLGNATSGYGTQSAGLSGITDSSNPWMQLLSQGVVGNNATLNNLLPYLMQQGTNQGQYSALPTNQVYVDPNMSAQVQGITNLTGNTSGMLNSAAQMLNAGGITNTQVPLGQYSQALMSGQTPAQQALLGTGTSILGTSGMTPALQNALDQASGVVSSSGQTGLTNQLAQTGLGLAGSSPLMSGAQAASIAEDQAGRGYANAAQTARENANLRGQGAGSTVANGAGNQALADTSDSALSQIAAAANNARLNQQSLGLTQQQQGLNTALGSAGLQQGLELGGLGAVGNLTNSSTNQLGVGGSLTNSAANLGTTGGSLYNALLGLQQGNMQQAYNAGSTGVSQQSNLLQTALQDLMNGQNNSVSTGSGLANAYLNNNNQLQNATNTGINANLSALGQTGSQASDWLKSAQGALNTYGSTGSSAADLLKQSPYSSLLNNAGAASTGSGGGLFGSILKGVGTIFGF